MPRAGAFHRSTIVLSLIVASQLLPSGAAAQAGGAAPSVATPTPASTGSQAAPPSAVSAPPFPAMKAILEDYQALRPGPVYDAAGKEFRAGHLTLAFQSGTFTAILTRSGKEAGFIFDGAGTYTYADDDPADRLTLQKNLLKYATLPPYVNGAVTEEMKGCVLLATSPVLPDLLGADAKPKGQGSESAAGRLSSFLEKADDVNVGIDHPAASAALAGRPGRIVYAEMDGKTLDPGFYFDPLLAKEEKLLMFRTITGDRIRSTVSTQRIEGGWHASPVQITRLEYSLSTENNKDANVTAAETIAVRESPGRVLPFLLINTTDDAATSWKSSKKTIDVRSVKLEGGQELPFSHRYNFLLVELPEAPAPGGTLRLIVDLQLHSLDTRGDEVYAVGAGSGFPDPIWQNSINATSHWKITTKKPYRAFTGGTTLARREEGGSMFLESEVDSPTNMPRLIAGKFDTKEFDKNGIKVRVSIYNSGTSRAYQSYADAAGTLLGVYGKALVPYPRKELDILEFKNLGFYQSPAGIVILPTESPTGESVAASRTEDWHLRTFCHELAHQWFGNIVTPRDWNADNWISESISEYLGALTYSAGGKDPKEQAEKLNFAVKRWWVDADMSRNSVSIARASYLRGDWTESAEYIQLLYSKGALVVRMLHRTYGEERFYRLLKTVLTKYAGKEIDTAEFAKETTAIVGQDMSWFFKQWIEEPGIPDLDVSNSIVQEGGKTWLTGHLKQRDPSIFKKLLVPFIYEDAGRPGVRLVLMEKMEQDFKIELPAGVKSVTVDPSRNNLVYYH